MYCKNEIFSHSLTFSEQRGGWNNIADVIYGGSVEEMGKLRQMIMCSNILEKDRQVENILTKNELRLESQKKEELRVICEQKLGITHSRRINFPLYNMKLNRR